MTHSLCRDKCEYSISAYNLFTKIAVNENHLKGLTVWIGASTHDKTSIQMKNLYSCVLSKLGVNVLDNDFDAILSDRVDYDVLLMFTFTAGSSARAIEIIVTGYLDKKSTVNDKLHIYMPAEYDKGYISRKISAHLISGKLIHKEHIKFRQLDKSIFSKCIANLIDVVNDRNKEMELTFKPRIAIITALQKEFNMMKQLLLNVRHDNSLKDEKIQFPHGYVGSNDVVLAMSGRGNNLSSSIATKLYDKYPSIEYTFVVGIAGGIPDLDNPLEHVSLGDLVLSDEKGVLQYDMKKTKHEGNEYNFSPRPPHSTLIRNSKIYVEGVGTGNYKYWGYLDKLLEDNSLNRPETQVLDESPWIENVTVGKPSIPVGYNLDRPRIHFGPIASANTVVKEVGIRNQLKDIFKAKAVEMEASGVADAAWLNGKNYFVVRGICDYANPNKNDAWQEYAAAAAAAFTCEIIEETLSHHS